MALNDLLTPCAPMFAEYNRFVLDMTAHHRVIETVFNRKPLEGKFVQSCMDLGQIFPDDPIWKISELKPVERTAEDAPRLCRDAQLMQSRVRQILEVHDGLAQHECREGICATLWNALSDTGLFTPADIDATVIEQVSAIPLEVALSGRTPKECCANAFRRIRLQLTSFCGAAGDVKAVTPVRFHEHRATDEWDIEPEVEFMPATQCTDRSGVGFIARLTEGQWDRNDDGESVDPFSVLVLRMESPCSRLRHSELIRDALRLTRVLHCVLAEVPWSVNGAFTGWSKQGITLDAETIAPPHIWRTAFQMYFSRPKDKPGQTVRNAVTYAEMLCDAKHQSTELLLAVAGLEALLSPGTRDTTDKIARRSAYLLAPTVSQRSEWMKTLRDVYDRRSRFVHGEDPDVTQAEARGAQVWFAEILRSLLYYYQLKLAAGESVDKAMTSVDEDFNNGRHLPTGFHARDDLVDELGLPKA